MPTNPFDDKIGALARQAQELARFHDVLGYQDQNMFAWAKESRATLLSQMNNSYVRTHIEDLSVMRTALENARSPLTEDVGAMRSAVLELQEFNARFQSPLEEQISQVREIMKNASTVRTLALGQDTIGRMSASIAEIKSPWVDLEDTIKSMTAATELYAISAGISDLEPFGGRLSSVLRSDFGDWRHIKSIPESVLMDPVERFGFYRYHGFNDSLTDFPEEAFDDLLWHSGLYQPDWPNPAPEYDVDLAIQSNDESEEVPESNQEAYKVIYRLETRLRQFIDTEMTRAFGSGWEKQQLPGDIYESWKTKKEARAKSGDSELPLIAYSDFTDYQTVIVKKDNWARVFRPIFSRKTDIQESLTRLQPVRICTMHCRVIMPDDQLLLSAEAQRIFRAIEK